MPAGVGPVTALTWPPPAISEGDITDLRHGLGHAFGDDPTRWDPEIRELLELACVTWSVIT